MSLPSANLVYPKALGHFLKAGINVSTAPLGVWALSSSYSYSPTDEFVSALSGHILTGGGPIAVSGVTVTNGVVTSSQPVTFPSPSGGNIKALVVAQNTGTPSTDLLLALIVRNADTTPMNEPTAVGSLPYTFASSILFYI